MTTKRDEFVKLLDDCVSSWMIGERLVLRAELLRLYDAASQPVAGEAPVMHALFGSDGHFIGRVAADSPFGVPLYTHPAPKAEPAGTPVHRAYLHTMTYETGETRVQPSMSADCPWGKRGKDFSDEYDLLCEPLYTIEPLAAAPPAPPKADAWDRCDACNGTLGDHYAPDQGGCPGFRKDVPPKPDAAAPDGWRLVPVEPTPEMLDAGAQRLVSWEDGCVWPDSWDALQVAAARNEAERVWRSMWLAASPARAEKDAEDARRYRWLRHGDHDELVLRSVGDKGGERPFDYRFDGCWLPRNEKLDAAIDAAMSGSKGAT